MDPQQIEVEAFATDAKAPFRTAWTKHKNFQRLLGALKFAGIAIALGLAITVGWIGRGYIAHEKPLPRLNEITKISAVSILSELSPVQAEQITTFSWPYNDIVIASNDTGTGLMMIASAPVSNNKNDEVRHVYSAVELDSLGKLRAAVPLGPLSPGRLTSAAGEAGSNLIFAFQSADSISILKRSTSGDLLWQRQTPYSAENTFSSLLVQMKDNLIAVLPGQKPEELSVVSIGSDGYPIWQRQIPSGAQATTLVERSVFDEVIIVSLITSLETEQLNVKALSSSGQVVLDKMITLVPGQKLIALDTDPSGTIFILLGGSAPQLILMSAFGDDMGGVNWPVEFPNVDEHDCVLDAGKMDIFAMCSSVSGVDLMSIQRQSNQSRMLHLNLIDQPHTHKLLSAKNQFFALTYPRAEDGDGVFISLLKANLSVTDASPPTKATIPPSPDLVAPEDSAINNIEPTPSLASDGPNQAQSDPVSTDSTQIPSIIIEDRSITCSLTCVDRDNFDLNFVITSQKTISAGSVLEEAIQKMAEEHSLTMRESCTTIGAIPKPTSPITCRK